MRNLRDPSRMSFTLGLICTFLLNFSHDHYYYLSCNRFSCHLITLLFTDKATLGFKFKELLWSWINAKLIDACTDSLVTLLCIIIYPLLLYLSLDVARLKSFILILSVSLGICISLFMICIKCKYLESHFLNITLWFGIWLTERELETCWQDICLSCGF